MQLQTRNPLVVIPISLFSAESIVKFGHSDLVV